MREVEATEEDDDMLMTVGVRVCALERLGAFTAGSRWKAREGAVMARRSKVAATVAAVHILPKNEVESKIATKNAMPEKLV